MVLNYECIAPFSDEEFNKEAEELVKEVLTKAQRVLPKFQYDQEVYVCITDDEEIHEINMEQRQIDKATDVLSFPMLEHKDGYGEVDELDVDPETNCVFVGDIIISRDHCEAQAKEYGHPVKRELAFLVCHGFLHLRGFDHIDPKDEEHMKETAEFILRGIAER